MAHKNVNLVEKWLIKMLAVVDFLVGVKLLEDSDYVFEAQSR